MKKQIFELEFIESMPNGGVGTCTMYETAQSELEVIGSWCIKRTQGDESVHVNRMKEYTEISVFFNENIVEIIRIKQVKKARCKANPTTKHLPKREV